MYEQLQVGIKMLGERIQELKIEKRSKANIIQGRAQQSNRSTPKGGTQAYVNYVD